MTQNSEARKRREEACACATDGPWVWRKDLDRFGRVLNASPEYLTGMFLAAGIEVRS